jgi:predicted TIM-barrel fold metal-dependent hydrolase
LDAGANLAVLVPRTRRFISDLRLGAEVCSATNDWLADTWLSKWNDHDQYRGSIRIDPQDPDAAIWEIERWSSSPLMLQVAVPMESLMPYGMKHYEPVWRAAATHGLPVAIMADGNSGVEGVRHFVELSLLGPLAFHTHLVSLVMHGVLERIPDLKFVFVDGGYDLERPLFWRVDKDWLANRSQTPWVVRPPTEYLDRRVYYCTSPLDGGPTQPADGPDWWRVSGAATRVLYASHFPRWNYQDPESASRSLPEDIRPLVMGGNAGVLYGDRLHMGAVAQSEKSAEVRPRPDRDVLQ